MKFIDQVKIYVKSGDGGKGCVSFRREKFIPKGGPNGGDGGRGGHIIFKAKHNINTLLDIKYQQQYRAEKGQHGMGRDRHGRDGRDLIIPVPMGTLVKNYETGEILFDLTEDDQEYIAAQGGRGGLGNTHFKGPFRHLIGIPNAGKSTLISSVSAAKPKIADYPFTTLVPNLGVVKYKEFSSFVIADIPGLIEGASQGTGLGFQFLRHVERTSVLLHLVDISEMAEGDPVNNLEKINNELRLFSSEIMDKPMAIAGTKLDIKGNGERLDRLADYCKDKHCDFFPICSVTGEGIDELVQYLAIKVEESKNRE